MTLKGNFNLADEVSPTEDRSNSKERVSQIIISLIYSFLFNIQEYIISFSPS